MWHIGGGWIACVCEIALYIYICEIELYIGKGEIRSFF